MEIKHNKYKNTGILFELLVRQIASDTISGKDSAAVNLVKKYFTKTELLKEYKLYQAIINSKVLNESKADMLIGATTKLSSRLNRPKLKSEKYNLIKEIGDNYSLNEFFKAKINNYSQYAAIYTLIEVENSKEFINPSQIINNKITLLEHIVRKEIDKDDVEDRMMEEYMSMDKGTRILIYRKLLEKFNNKYADFNVHQKSILKEYINNISNTIKLKEFVDNHYISIKKELKTLSKSVSDQTIQIKLNEIINLIKPLDKNQNVKDDDLTSLLQYHQLIAELKLTK